MARGKTAYTEKDHSRNPETNTDYSLLEPQKRATKSAAGSGRAKQHKKAWQLPVYSPLKTHEFK